MTRWQSGLTKVLEVKEFSGLGIRIADLNP